PTDRRRPQHECQSALTASKTSAACPGTLTPLHSRASFPSGAIRNVDRSMPRTCLPYMFFILITPNCLHSISSGSEISSKGNPSFALKLSCDLRLSRETPTTTAPALTNRLYRSRNWLPSVVHPGVLSLG